MQDREFDLPYVSGSNLDGSAPDMRKTTCHQVVFVGGQGRDRTGDLPLFRRTLVPTELPGRTAGPNYLLPRRTGDPDGTRTRDLRRDRAAR